MPKEPSGTYFEKLLDQGGTRAGRNAFDFLCQRSCDRETLGGLFVLLTHKEILRLKADPKRGHERDVEIRLNRLDVEDPLGGMSLRKLRQIASRAERLAAEIIRLRKTLLVRHLKAQGALAPNDLLSGSPLSTGASTAFQGVLSLPDLAKRFGAQSGRPEHTRRLTKIYRHIRQCTGQWHDAKVAHILNALDPYVPQTEQALKEWRKRHNLTG